MFSMHVPKRFWGVAILTTSNLINRMPKRVLSYQTPLQILHNYFSDNRNFTNLPSNVFGCTVFTHIPNHIRGK